MSVEITVNDLSIYYDKWCKWLELQFSSATSKAYKSDCLSFIESLDKNEKVLINKNVVYSWLTNRARNGIVNRSNARGLSSIKSFISFLIHTEEVDGLDDIIKIKSPKVPSLLPKNVEQPLDFLACFNSDKWDDVRDRAICMLMYGSGLRVSEVLNIKYRDIHDNKIRVFGKGGTERIVFLLPDVKQAMDEYMSTVTYSYNQFVFLGARGNKLNTSVVRRNIAQKRHIFGFPESVTPHSFRHSFATDMINNGADLRSVQELLGHKSIASTQIYVKLSRKKIKEEYEKCHPVERGEIRK